MNNEKLIKLPRQVEEITSQLDSNVQEINKVKTDYAKKSEVNTLATNKVDKVEGKGLSTNDYNNTEKSEVAKIKDKAEKSVADSAHTRIDNLLISSGNANAEVSDAHVSTAKNKTFTTIRNRMEESEQDYIRFVDLNGVNVIDNGDFSNGTNLWSGNANTSVAVVDNCLIGTNTVSGSFSISQPRNKTVTVGNKYYIMLELKSNVAKNVGFRLGVNKGFPAFTFTPTNEFKKYSEVVTATSTATDTFNIFVSGAVQNDNLTIKRIIVLDLTSIFGLGLEPTETELNIIFSGDKVTLSPTQKELVNAIFKTNKKIDNTVSEVQGMVNEVKDLINNNIESPVDTKTIADKVLNLQKEDTLTFAFFTDSHVLKSNLDTLKTIKSISKRSKIEFIAHGGDIVDGMVEKSVELENLSKIFEYANTINVPFVFCKGNHDDNNFYPRTIEKSNMLNMYTTNLELYNRTTRFCENKLVVGSREGMYYYLDHEPSKIRIIFLNSNDIPFEANQDGTAKYNCFDNNGYRNTQLNWLANKALDFSSKPNKNEWGVILMGHMAGDEIVLNNDVLYGILDAFRKGTSYNKTSSTPYDGYSVNVNYSSQGAIEVISFISGDMHSDSYFRYTPFRKIKTRDSINSQAIDIFTIDRKQKKIFAHRYGSGSDREIIYD